MPDVSVIPELCELLQITANELLAGESLDNSDSFSKKAEENIMELTERLKTVYGALSSGGVVIDVFKTVKYAGFADISLVTETEK